MMQTPEFTKPGPLKKGTSESAHRIEMRHSLLPCGSAFFFFLFPYSISHILDCVRLFFRTVIGHSVAKEARPSYYSHAVQFDQPHAFTFKTILKQFLPLLFCLHGCERTLSRFIQYQNRLLGLRQPRWCQSRGDFKFPNAYAYCHFMGTHKK